MGRVRVLRNPARTNPLPFLGDFNELIGLSEKEGGGNRPAAQMVSFLNTINRCGFHHLSSSVLDHCPLSLQLFRKAKKEKFQRMFRFESMWLKDQKCEKLVNRAWDDGRLANLNFPLVKCLDICRSRML